jgi:hypothetical protein
MLPPDVPTRVEQRNGFTLLRIKGVLPVGFATVALKTGQREIVNRVSATWQNMIHSEWVVLPSFVCVAILAQVLSSLSNLNLKSGGDFARH